VKDDRVALLQELHLSHRSRLLLFVGRPLPDKGLDTLIEAVKPMLRDHDTSLLVVGAQNDGTASNPGPGAEFVKCVKQALAADRLSHAVRWLGWRDDVGRLMASADVLVHPTRHEGFGLVLAEALATGLPVVASNVGGIPEVVAGTDSILVPPDDVAALQEAVQRVLNRTSEEAEAARQKGRARAEFFRTERRTDELLAYFKALCRL
jgi:glycosyltransferase involved in cell wall biosynthesis